MLLYCFQHSSLGLQINKMSMAKTFFQHWSCTVIKGMHKLNDTRQIDTNKHDFV